jgi:hypothetical protein
LLERYAGGALSVAWEDVVKIDVPGPPYFEGHWNVMDVVVENAMARVHLRDVWDPQLIPLTWDKQCRALLSVMRREVSRRRMTVVQ